MKHEEICEAKRGAKQWGRKWKTAENELCVPPASCLSWVPEQGTVGASGDLAPLAHLALGLMGEGKMWSPQSGWADANAVSSYTVTHHTPPSVLISLTLLLSLMVEL